MTTRPHLRSGFTLVEMLIVMGIILILATLGFLFLPNLDRNKGVPNGATQVQGWINLMKQQALRDQKPKGVRLIHDGTGKCTQMQYIEQPDPVAPRGPGIKVFIETHALFDPTLFPYPIPGFPPGTGPVSVVTLFQDPGNLVAPTQSPPSSMWKTWEGVDIGDYLELSDNPKTIAVIRAFSDFPVPGPPPFTPAPGTPPRSQLVLDRVIEGTENLPVLLAPPPAPPPGMPPPTTAMHVQTGFRVIRAPRPLVGEPMLHMHKDVYIDLTGCFPCPLNLDWLPPGQHPSGLAYAFPNGAGGYYTFYAPWGPQPIPPALQLPQPVPVDRNYIDILFNSQGFVANAPVGEYILLVRHVDRPNDMLLVTVYTRTGKISAHSVNDFGGDPYGFTRDGKSPGL